MEKWPTESEQLHMFNQWAEYSFSDRATKVESHRIGQMLYYECKDTVWFNRFVSQTYSKHIQSTFGLRVTEKRPTFLFFEKEHIVFDWDAPSTISFACSRLIDRKLSFLSLVGVPELHVSAVDTLDFLGVLFWVTYKGQKIPGRPSSDDLTKSSLRFSSLLYELFSRKEIWYPGY